MTTLEDILKKHKDAFAVGAHDKNGIIKTHIKGRGVFADMEVMPKTKYYILRKGKQTEEKIMEK